jgi:protein-tyrosine kinase
MHMLRVAEYREYGIKGEDIGDILINAGKLNEPDLQRIVALQGKEELLFGEAAVALGILSEEDVRWALACQYSYPGVNLAELPAELIAAHDPADPRVEMFRSIRGGLIFSGAAKMIKSFAVCSAEAGEGKSYVAANLALVFAQLGVNTLLVDLNFREPRQHQLFKMKNNTGASSLMIRRALPEQALQRTAIQALSVLPSGPKPPNPSELLSWHETRELVTGLSSQYDLVIIDTPAFTRTADAMMAASFCDGVVLTARKGKSRLGPFGQMKRQLEGSGVRILGSVLNEF